MFFSVAFRTIDRVVLFVLWMIIRLYRLFLSPLFGSQCRFSPSCSDYALRSVKKHSSYVAFFKITKRLLKCHPFHLGGFDPL